MSAHRDAEADVPMATTPTPSEAFTGDPGQDARWSAAAPQAPAQAAQPSYIGALPEPRARVEPERAPVAYPEHDAGYVGQLPRPAALNAEHAAPKPPPGHVALPLEETSGYVGRLPGRAPQDEA